MRVTKRIVIEVDYNDFEETVNSYFRDHHGFSGFDEAECFSFPESEECSNDSSHSFDRIDGKIENWHATSLQACINEKNFLLVRARTLLNYLCSKGQIEVGDYLVKVSW